MFSLEITQIARFFIISSPIPSKQYSSPTSPFTILEPQDHPTYGNLEEKNIYKTVRFYLQNSWSRFSKYLSFFQDFNLF